MAWAVYRRLRRFLNRGAWDSERRRELESYLDMETQRNLSRGVPLVEAHFAAQRKLGNTTHVREEIREMNSLGIFETLWQDLRYGLRLLRLNPGFAAAAILSLALGIGANTAIFQLLDAVRIRTLPVNNPQELRQIKIDKPNGRSGSFTTRYPAITNAIWEGIRDNQQGFSGTFAWAPWPFNVADAGEVRSVEGIWVSGEFFNVLGVQPLMGRLFSSADDTRGCAASGAVVSYAFWQREFAGRADVTGQQIHVNHHAFEIIGVTPPAFYGVEVGKTYQIALPICAEPVVMGEGTGLGRHDYWWLTAVGRSKPGWSDDRAAAQLRAVSPQIFDGAAPTDFNPKELAHFRGYKLGVFPGATGNSELRATYENPLVLLLALSGLVLLIACGNLTNLMLARASTRAREMAVRLAIGASRGRLVRQLLAESLLLSAIGAGAGVLLARWMGSVLIAFLSTRDNPLFVNLGTDWRMVAFTAGLAILTCVLIGLTPALRATRIAPGSTLKSAGRGMTAGRERFGLRKALVISQVALSLVLVVGALLFTRSLSKIMSENAGFVPDGVLIADADYARAKIPKAERMRFQLDLIDRVRSIPGVTGAASTSIVPITDSSWNQNVLYSPLATDSPGQSYVNEVSDEYFETMGVRMIAGRSFNARDLSGGPYVAVVNQAFARKFFAGKNPLGQRFSLQKLSVKDDVSLEIVGLVADTKYDNMHSELAPITYLSIRQDNKPEPDLTMVVRASVPLDTVSRAISEKLADVNPDLRFSVLKTVIRDSLLSDRLMAMLSGFFGALAALLASIGLYGVISYMVMRRKGEFGIRLALGAQRGDIVSIVMREAGILVAIGIAVGAGLAIAGSGVAKTLLYGLAPHDPVTLGLAVGMIAVIAVVASCVPALRASRMDPAATLREE
jgi:predicted permease